MTIKIPKEDWYLITVFILMAVAVAARSFFNSDGHLSPDSTNYLALAQNLLEGNGFYTVGTGLAEGGERVFFATWPAGYPALIYLASSLFHIPVFWASKLVNIIFIGLSLILLRISFKQNAYIYGSLFLMAAYIRIFTSTYSEAPFIFGLIWLSLSMHRFVLDENSRGLMGTIFLSALFLFLTRYVGAIGFALTGVLAVYYLSKRKYKVFAQLALLSLLGVLIVGLYLYHNYARTGYPTGMPRIPSPESSLELLTWLVLAVFKSLNLAMARVSGSEMIFFAMCFVQLAVFSYFVIKDRKYWRFANNEKKVQPWQALLIVGGAYLASIIAMRWVKHFAVFNTRLLGPGFLLLFMALINYTENNFSRRTLSSLTKFLVIMALFSYLLNVPVSVYKEHRGGRGTYHDKVLAINKFFEQIPPASVVIFPDWHAHYLRTDIVKIRPFAAPYQSRKESLPEVLARVDDRFAGKRVYFQVRGVDFGPQQYHESITGFIGENGGRDFVRIR